MMKVSQNTLRDPQMRSREHRLFLLTDVLHSWIARQERIENMVMDSFQEQDLDKIADLLTEKKILERRISTLSNFLEEYQSYA